MDIMYMPWTFNGMRYILTCVDVYSRLVKVVPLRSRTGPTILKATKELFEKKFKKIPKNINVDNEFNYKAWMEYMSQNNVKVWLSYADDIIDSKNAIIERWHRTIREKVQAFELNTKRKDWPAYIGILVDAYNNQYHNTVKGAPSQIFKGIEENTQKVIVKQDKFKVGDLVRIKNTKKSAFTKTGDQTTFSTDVYKIIKKLSLNRFQLQNTETGDILKLSLIHI